MLGRLLGQVEPLGPQRVRFTQGEVYTGLLIPLFASTLEREARPAFEGMNRALKQRAEQAPQARGVS